jgi:hypothetical protein
MSANEVEQQGFNYQRGVAIRISKLSLKSDGETYTQARGNLAGSALGAKVARQPLFYL